MISIGNTYLVEMMVEKKKGAIFLPDDSFKSEQVIARIINKGLLVNDPDLNLGDIIVMERLGATTTLKHNGQNVTIVPHHQILAMVEGGEYVSETNTDYFERKTSAVKYYTIPKTRLDHVTGRKLGIYPDKAHPIDLVNGIYIPKYMEEQQIVRTNRGIVCRINEETEKLTGITIGMKVVYDYYSVYSHDTEFHITNVENILAVMDNRDDEEEKK